MDETWILQRFLARDEEGLAAAYAQLGPGLTALAARIAGPETDEECVNDALLAAASSPSRSTSWPSVCRAAKARPTARRRRSCAARSPPFCARSRSVSGRSFWRGIFTPCR